MMLDVARAVAARGGAERAMVCATRTQRRYVERAALACDRRDARHSDRLDRCFWRVRTLAGPLPR